MRLQYRVWFGLDLGLGIKVGDPEINEEVIYPIKMISNELVLSEAFIVLLVVIWVGIVPSVTPP